MIRVLAIDDEPLALRQLEMYIAKVPFLKLVAPCGSAAAAKPHLESVDAVFLDINMPDISGMDFIKSLPHPPAVVFTTAYSEYAVEGFRVNAVDYLLKPFSFNEFFASCNKLREHIEMKAALSEREADPILHFRVDYHTVNIDARKIVYVESMSEYIRLWIDDREEPLVVLYRLRNLASELPADRFLQIHRSYLINLSRIRGISHGNVTLDNGKTLPIGDSYRPALKEYLSNKS